MMVYLLNKSISLTIPITITIPTKMDTIDITIKNPSSSTVWMFNLFLNLFIIDNIIWFVPEAGIEPARTLQSNRF